MTESKAPAKGGLEGVVAADSAIGKIDGTIGDLRYCGYQIKELADAADFAETTWLLWNLELPNRKELEAFRKELTSWREVPGDVLDIVRKIAGRTGPMDALRTAVSVLALDDIEGPVDDRDTNMKRAVRITARFPTLIAAYARLREGKEPIASRADLSHAANFLYMLTGDVPTKGVERMFDVCLVLHAEHGFNASTFAARVTAATLSDMYSALTSAIGTLKGPLHGGANTAVMNMLLEIGDVDGVEAHLDHLLASKQKVMGFGHRVYKVVDPRAVILKGFASRMAQETGEPKWYAMSERVETLMKARKGLDMNVDFYSASTYYYMGVQPDMFTTIFALSRVSGWIAHILEQYGHNRLIRPRANWVGSDSRAYVSLAER